jgi:hypothetical protein
VLLGAPVTPVPRPGSLWGALWPDVAGARSLVIGVWLWADAIPLDTSRIAAANNAECFLMVASFVAPGLNVLIEANVPSRSSRPLWRIAPGCWPKVEEDVARSDRVASLEEAKAQLKSWDALEGVGKARKSCRKDGSAEAPRAANTCVPVAPRLLTLTDHPGFDLVVIFIRMGDRAERCYLRSRLVMVPDFQ